MNCKEHKIHMVFNFLISLVTRIKSNSISSNNPFPLPLTELKPLDSPHYSLQGNLVLSTELMT